MKTDLEEMQAQLAALKEGQGEKVTFDDAEDDDVDLSDSLKERKKSRS